MPMRPTSKLHFILTRYIFLWTTGKWMVGAQPHRGHSDNRISRKRSHGIELLDDRRTGWVLWSRSRVHTLPGGPRSTRLPQPLKISILQPFKIFSSFFTCVFIIYTTISISSCIPSLSHKYSNKVPPKQSVNPPVASQTHCGLLYRLCL